MDREKHIEEQEPSFPQVNRWLGWLQSLRVQLVVPYVLLTLVTAMVGTFIVTRLVTSSLRERFENQLVEASRVAADGVVRQENEHLQILRSMVFTVGVSEAVAAGDEGSVQSLLFPIVVNEEVDLLTVVDQTGVEIISLVRDPNSETYFTSSGSRMGSYEIVTKSLRGEVDPLGDKFASILHPTFGEFLVTSSAIKDAEEQIVGALLVGTRLDTLVADLKSQSLADVILLHEDGGLRSASFATTSFEEGQMLALSTQQSQSLDPTMEREIDLFQRRYQILYSPFYVRQEPVGILGIALPSNFLVSTEATSRTALSLLFALSTATILALGFLLARRISEPILQLRDMSKAVASGDLNQRTGLKRGDEIGQLAEVFDVMTGRLEQRTSEAQQLYLEVVERNEDLAESNTKLQQAQQQLVQSEKLAAVGQLTAGIVHDVKNPLAVIKGLAEEVQEDTQNNPEAVESLGLIRESATRANTIVSDLLKFARQSEPQMRQQNLCETIESAIRLTDYLARKGRVRLNFEAEKLLIPTTYDAQQIEQVLVNLIQNAIQAMSDGGAIDIGVRELEDQIEIVVADTGSGIAPENLNRIFDPFFTTKPEGQGTGLGLSVSHGIVAQHEGSISVQSVVGSGTTFTILLPRTT